GCPFSRRVRPWYARAIGSADGSIIATIITTMSAKKRARSVDPNVAGAITAIARSDEVQVTYHATATRAATPTPTGIVRRRSKFGGVARSTASIGVSVAVGEIRTHHEPPATRELNTIIYADPIPAFEDVSKRLAMKWNMETEYIQCCNC